MNSSPAIIAAVDLIGLLSGTQDTQLGKVGILPFVILIGVSLLFSIIAMWMYSYFYASRATGSQIHRAFPLLGVSVTAIFICIQFSLPLSLGLLGALSIVRFRTPIKEPEEVAFIMFVIAGAISCATFNLIFLSILTAVAFVGLTFLNFGPAFAMRSAGSGTLVVTFSGAGENGQQDRIVQVVQDKIPKARLDAVRSANGECALTFAFPKLSPTAAGEVQNAVRAVVSDGTFQLFYNRAETIA